MMKRSLWTTLAGWSLPEHTGISDDLDLLIHALSPAPGLQFLSISSYGAGEAALALAASGATTVMAYDIGDAQMIRRLIDLKICAAGVLSHKEYLALMGLSPSTRSQKQAIIKKTLKALSGSDYSFWAKHWRWFIPGLFFSNQQTFFMQILWFFIRLFTPSEARRQMLFSKSPDTRIRTFRQYVSRPWLKWIFAQLGSRINFFYPEAEWSSSDYPKVFNRDPFPYFEHLIGTGLPGNPLFAHYFLDGDRSLQEPLLPPHLRPQLFSALRTAAERVQVVSSNIGDLPPLPQASRSYHGAYLSNIIDYLGPDDRQRLIQEVSRVLVSGAPVLIYSNELYDKVPAGCGLVPDQEASTRLAAQDQVRTYSRVGLFRSSC
jgi:S-adenosylmethionine:diacylglycerol 3-amino-3-carboxypropyl transferase